MSAARSVPRGARGGAIASPGSEPPAAVTTVHVVVPDDIDDPATPSGGNTYDRRICQGLAATGWSVREHAVRGAWPQPDGPERAQLAQALSAVPDDAIVLIDGLIASAVPDVLVPQARRLRLVVLVHMPLGDDTERAALAAARGVVTTSAWTRRRLLDLYGLPADRVHVATPGVDPARLAPGSDAGTELLCVAAVTPHKGHDLLAEALAKVADRPWTCVCVGSLSRDPDFVGHLRRQVEAYGLADRIRLAGPRTADRLDAAYAAADLLLLPSRGETYGMVVTEALARGIPVLATAAGGLAEALGRAPDGSLPGMLVEPGDPAALAGALRHWLSGPDLRGQLSGPDLRGQLSGPDLRGQLSGPDLRGQLRRSARGRRSTLTGWAVTAELISKALAGVSHGGAS